MVLIYLEKSFRKKKGSDLFNTFSFPKPKVSVFLHFLKRFNNIFTFKDSSEISYQLSEETVPHRPVSEGQNLYTGLWATLLLLICKYEVNKPFCLREPRREVMS